MVYTGVLFPSDTETWRHAAQGRHDGSAPHRDVGPAQLPHPLGGDLAFMVPKRSICIPGRQKEGTEEGAKAST